MSVDALYKILNTSEDLSVVEKAIADFVKFNKANVHWQPVGDRANNSGTIEVSGDSGRSLVERITNGADAVLEEEHDSHAEKPSYRSPHEAARAWLSIPEEGLNEMSTRDRQKLAERLEVKVLSGEGRGERVVEVRDRGIGIRPEEMSKTILSLNESNKWQKHYLAGTYGQGGSSTFASAKYTFIASRYGNQPEISFTIVRFQDLPADQYKTGNYVYLTLKKQILVVKVPLEKFSRGTLVKHFGYDLSKYPSPLGPNSIYGLFNHALFDPVLPFWLVDKVQNYRRVIKGARNALNGAVDVGDEKERGKIAYSMPIFYIPLGKLGKLGFEYWVLEQEANKTIAPIASYVNPQRPIILTLNGQTHAELSKLIIKKDVELPYLDRRLICHLKCDSLSPESKRTLFISNREDIRKSGLVFESLHKELLRVLKSDDELNRLNKEARAHSIQERDESTEQEIRREVARILRIQGLDVSQLMGGGVTSEDDELERPVHPAPRPPHIVEPIEIHDPPTYVRILSNKDEDIEFYPSRRRYIRIETDAPSHYYRPKNPDKSHFKVVIEGKSLVHLNTTPIEGGRTRIVLEAPSDAKIGDSGRVSVLLERDNMESLSDSRSYKIIQTPPSQKEEDE